MKLLDWLQSWYENNCDGDWEHLFGVTIETWNNSGWKVKVDLEDTYLEDKNFASSVKFLRFILYQ